jgi:transcriptional regulator with GAF, ATPase, and Fis domain
MGKRIESIPQKCVEALHAYPWPGNVKGVEVERRHIIEALNTTGWRVSGKDGAAEMSGVNPKTLELRMQRLGIQRSKRNA